MKRLIIFSLIGISLFAEYTILAIMTKSFYDAAFGAIIANAIALFWLIETKK